MNTPTISPYEPQCARCSICRKRYSSGWMRWLKFDSRHTILICHPCYEKNKGGES